MKLPKILRKMARAFLDKNAEAKMKGEVELPLSIFSNFPTKERKIIAKELARQWEKMQVSEHAEKDPAETIPADPQDSPALEAEGAKANPAQ